MFKIADSDQRKNAQISHDPDPTDRIRTSLVPVSNSSQKNLLKPYLNLRQYWKMTT